MSREQSRTAKMSAKWEYRLGAKGVKEATSRESRGLLAQNYP